MSDANPLGERIGLALDASGMSPEDLAAQVDVDWRTVYRWQSGENSPRRKSLTKIAKATGIRFEWLRDGKGEMREPAAAEAQEGEGSLTTRRPHVHLDDSAPRPDPHRLLVARIYNRFGEFVGFRYAVTDLQRVPYEIVLHPDGTEEVRQPEPVNREAA